MVEMVIRLEDESMLAPLKRVIKSIAGIADVMVRKDVKTKAKGEVYARQLARVNELAALQNDWDDNGALPIEKKVIKSGDASISIDNTEFSYVSNNYKGAILKKTTI